MRNRSIIFLLKESDDYPRKDLKMLLINFGLGVKLIFAPTKNWKFRLPVLIFKKTETDPGHYQCL